MPTNAKLLETIDHGLSDIHLNPFVPGKYTPPRIDPAFHLLRPLALRPLIETNRKRHAVIAVQARAGQGKSILIAQFLQYIQARFSWLQVGEEDRDPVVFVAALFASLMKALPNLNQSLIHQTIINGEVVGHEAAGLVPELIKALKPHLGDNFYLVIDDIHLLKGAKDSLSFLDAIIGSAPSGLRLILLSREPIHLNAMQGKTLLLDNVALAWTHNDVAMLFNQVFKRPLPADTLAELHKSTEGWVMGLIMAGHAMSDGAHAGSREWLQRLTLTHANQFQGYFANEILNTLPPDQRRSLLSLALLDHIPCKLAQSLGLTDNVEALLDHLVRRNFFLRRLDATQPTYAFHHLFQEFLRSQACKELGLGQRRRILARSGQWLMRQNQYEHAMRYYLRAGAYGMVEKILRRVGLQLMGANKTATIQETMDHIPEEVIRSHAWLSLTVAFVLSSSDPPRSKIYLDMALQLSITQQDELCELMVLISLMTYHAGVDCQFKEGSKLLARAEALHAELSENQIADAFIQPTCYLAVGLCYFTGQTRKAAEYIDQVYKLAQSRGLEDAMAAAMSAQGLICIFEGNWDALKKVMEQSLFLMQSRRVSNFKKLSLVGTQFIFLAMSGDFETYRHYRALLDHTLEASLFTNTLFGSSLLIMDLNAAMADGRYEEALQFARQGLALTGSGQAAHLQSQHLSFYSYLSALVGHTDEAISAARKAASLRKQAGGTYYEVACKLILSGTYAILGRYDQAEPLLDEVIPASETLGEINLNAGAYAHRAYVRLNTDRTAEALEDIRACLKIMKRDQRVIFYAWNPRVAQTVLKAAVQHGIEPQYSLSLAAERLGIKMTPEGDQIPSLEVACLGGLQIKLDGQVKISFSDLTATQRELLAVLAGAAQTHLRHETIQDLLWPESSPAKGRSKLDNLLARLRKVLDERLSPHPAANYIIVEKGIVRLQNCRIDADHFAANVLQGRHYLNKQEVWQAGNAFLRAHMAYQGAFFDGVRPSEQILIVRETLQRSYLDNALLLTQMLSAAQRPTQAIQVCQQALRSDPSHEPLVKILYDLWARGNHPKQASQVIADYRQALGRTGFSEPEIEEIMNGFWQGR